jgi:hypothetical protein
VVTSPGDDAEREAAAALVGECPTRLHEEDRLVLLPGVLAVRAWGLAWLVPLATLGLLVSRALPPATAAGIAGAVLAPIRATGGWGIPAPAHALVGQLLVVALALAAGLWLATWKPGGVTPRQYALAGAPEARNGIPESDAEASWWEGAGRGGGARGRGDEGLPARPRPPPRLPGRPQPVGDG